MVIDLETYNIIYFHNKHILKLCLVIETYSYVFLNNVVPFFKKNETSTCWRGSYMAAIQFVKNVNKYKLGSVSVRCSGITKILYIKKHGSHDSIMIT